MTDEVIDIPKEDVRPSQVDHSDVVELPEPTTSHSNIKKHIEELEAQEKQTVATLQQIAGALHALRYLLN